MPCETPYAPVVKGRTLEMTVPEGSTPVACLSIVNDFRGHKPARLTRDGTLVLPVVFAIKGKLRKCRDVAYLRFRSHRFRIPEAALGACVPEK